MSKWDYNFGVSLPTNIEKKLEFSDLLRKPLPHADTAGFEKNAFHSDGYPVSADPYTVYPSLLHRIIGTPVPEYLMEMSEDYRRRASIAAIQWLEKVMGKNLSALSFNGLSFQSIYENENIDFCFPDTQILCLTESAIESCAVLTFPDTHNNDEDWEYGAVPRYAEDQAQLMIWCSRQYAAIHPDYLPCNKAFLVRIKGNLSVDNTIRTVNYDPQQARRILQKIAKAHAVAISAGTPIAKAPVIIPKCDWKAEKQLDLDNAYQLENPDLYDLLGRYMNARSIRKSLERQAKDIKDRMDSIAVAIASEISPSASQGEIEVNDMIYTVKHVPKRSYPTTISAELVRQFAPQYAEHIHVSSVPRGRITIETL